MPADGAQSSMGPQEETRRGRNEDPPGFLRVTHTRDVCQRENARPLGRTCGARSGGFSTIRTGGDCANQCTRRTKRLLKGS
jgi:hypothetical protein